MSGSDEGPGAGVARAQPGHPGEDLGAAAEALRKELGRLVGTHGEGARQRQAAVHLRGGTSSASLRRLPIPG